MGGVDAERAGDVGRADVLGRLLEGAQSHDVRAHRGGPRGVVGLALLGRSERADGGGEDAGHPGGRREPRALGEPVDIVGQGGRQAHGGVGTVSHGIASRCSSPPPVSVRILGKNSKPYIYMHPLLGALPRRFCRSTLETPHNPVHNCDYKRNTLATLQGVPMQIPSRTVLAARFYYRHGVKVAELARLYGVRRDTMSRYLHGHTHADLTEPPGYVPPPLPKRAPPQPWRPKVRHGIKHGPDAVERVLAAVHGIKPPAPQLTPEEQAAAFRKANPIDELQAAKLRKEQQEENLAWRRYEKEREQRRQEQRSDGFPTTERPRIRVILLE